jgi:hypothetical protein
MRSIDGWWFLLRFVLGSRQTPIERMFNSSGSEKTKLTLADTRLVVTKMYPALEPVYWLDSL